MERELKLVLDAPDYLRLASSLPGYAGERWLANHYFDTSDRALRSKGAMLRIRETEDGRIVGLKQAVSIRDGEFEAAEREAPLEDRDWLRLVRAGGDVGILDHPVVREAFALAGADVLPYQGVLRVLRKRYAIASPDGLELDLVSFEDGSQDYELEVETERPESTRPFLKELLESKRIAWREQTLTKYERFLAHPTRQTVELCESREGEIVMVDEGVLVRRTPLLGTGVFATREFAAGEVLFELAGAILTGTFPRDRGMGWIQIGPRSFLDVAGTIGRHLNHSCLPNTGIRGSRTLVAIRPIAPGDEVTYDYAMTEHELDLVCCCGTHACRGLIGGYSRLPGALKRLYAPWVSEYLREGTPAEERRDPILEDRLLSPLGH
jgi:uncharacterized protein YjbK